jgi:hypothetical protein
VEALKGMLQGDLLKDLQYQEFEKTFNKICFDLDVDDNIEDYLRKMINQNKVINRIK